MTFGEVWEFLSENSEHKVLRSRITLGDILHHMLACKQEVIDAKGTIAALTARAEQSEARERAAIKDIRRHCATCLYGQQEDGRCAIGVNGKCYFGGYDYWTWRGLPQDGEGK